MLKYDVIQVGPLFVNCVIVYKDSSGVVFDAGGDAGKIDKVLKLKNIKDIILVNTHGHFDHIGAVKKLKKLYDTKFLMSIKDQFLLKQASAHSSYFGLGNIEEPTIDIDLDNSDFIDNNVTEIVIIKTPGHTPGGLSFYLPELKLLISGDTLFKQSIGRTDFPYSNYSYLETSVRELYKLPDETVVIPGHGEFTKIGYEKRYNDFIKEKQ